MSVYNSSHTGLQIDACADTYQNAAAVQAIVDAAITAAKLAMYPIGSIYMSLSNVSPATFIGGTWEQIEDTFLLAAGTNYSVGDTGGKAEYVADDMPAHTHTRGTMNITGAQQLPNVYADNDWPKYSAGAMYWSKRSGWFDNGDNGTCNNVVINFDASRAWTGETSQSGLNETATIMPPYLAVYVWKRIA